MMDASTSDTSAIITADFMDTNHQRADSTSEPCVAIDNDHQRRCTTARRWLLTWLCLAALGQSMSINGLIGVTISTIERRFELASSQTAWITSAYELAGVPALLVVGYIGSRVRRPVWISAGLVILSVGIFTYALPHFIAPRYRYDTGDNSTGTLCVVGQTAEHTQCQSTGDVTQDNVALYLALFVISSLLMGVGSVPLYVLGVTYIDDSAPHSVAAFDLGVFYSMSVFGPVLAFIGGGFLLKVYDDFNRNDIGLVTMTDSDPRWVGAWWLGFLISLALVVVTILPIICYPTNPPGMAEHKQSRDQSNAELDGETVASSRDLELDLSAGSWRDIPRSVWTLLTNWPYLFTVLYGTCDAMLIDGFQTFGPKYLQQQFGLSSSMSAIIFGIMAVPGGAGGFLVGSYLVKRFSLSCSVSLRLMFVLSTICLASLFAFTIQCDTAPFAGVHPDARYGSFNSSCNNNCGCTSDWFDPVCADSDLTYFSACYAGCRQGSTDGYSDCSCLHDNATLLPPSNASVVSGVCPTSTCQLWKLILFVFIFFIAMFIIFMCAMFHLSVILRVVPHSQRPLSYAIDWMLQRLVGAMPGPVLFGYVLDHSCLLWQKKCDSSGACLYYDNHQMAWLMLAVCSACKLLNVIFGLVAWRVHESRKSPAVQPRTAVEAYRTMSLNRSNRVSILDQFHSSVMSDSTVFANESELELNQPDDSVI